MSFLNFIVFLGVNILILPCAHSTDIESHYRVKRDRPLFELTTGMTKVLKLLAIQDEKITELQLTMAVDKFTPTCVARIKAGNVIGASKCWKQLQNQIKRFGTSKEVESSALNQIIGDAYEGEQTRLPLLVKFIAENIEKGSNETFTAYKNLLEEMESYGQLYLKQISDDVVIGGGIVSYTHRVLFSVKEAEGVETNFTSIPIAERYIISQEEVFIRNNHTKAFMYAENPIPCATKYNCSLPVSKVMVDEGNGNDPKYLWKFKPVESKWKEQNFEIFHIVNSLDNKMLAVRSGDGSLKVAEATSEQMKSTWSMFYLHLVEGNQVVIQCSYWGLKTLALDESDGLKIPKLSTPKPLEETPSAIWSLEPKPLP